jgi:hypothetical protein
VFDPKHYSKINKQFLQITALETTSEHIPEAPLTNNGNRKNSSENPRTFCRFIGHSQQETFI